MDRLDRGQLVEAVGVAPRAAKRSANFFGSIAKDNIRRRRRELARRSARRTRRRPDRRSRGRSKGSPRGLWSEGPNPRSATPWGAYVAREAFDHADDGTVRGSDWALNQLVLIAGDVEASDFVEGNKQMALYVPLETAAFVHDIAHPVRTFSGLSCNWIHLEYLVGRTGLFAI